MKRLAAALALCLALAGCGTAAHDTPPPPPPAASSAAVAPAPAAPISLDIPAIGVHRPVQATGLNPDGTIAVPPLEQPQQVDWYRFSPVPGDRGPAVLLAHVNAYGTPGAFARLHELRPGDVVQIERSDARFAQFRVTRVDTVPKDAFPTDAVYGDTPGPEIRLVTCGGALDRAAHSYKSNVIVTGVLQQ